MRRQLVDMTAAAEYLGRPRSFVKSLCRQRRVPHYRQGGKIMLDLADLDRYLDDIRVDATVDRIG